MWFVMALVIVNKGIIYFTNSGGSGVFFYTKYYYHCWV